MKSVNHTGFDVTLNHEKHDKIKGRQISLHNKAWKIRNHAVMHNAPSNMAKKYICDNVANNLEDNTLAAIRTKYSDD